MPATLGPPGSYTRSVLGGASDRNAAHPAGALSTVGSQQAHRQQADGQQQQAETSWSLLGKMYSSSVLAYMVAITDAQALVRRMRSMRPGRAGLKIICAADAVKLNVARSDNNYSWLPC